MHRTRRFSVITLALSSLTVLAAYATTLTYEQGYSVGCGLGNAETYLDENRPIAMATVDDFAELGEVQYSLGAMEGYLACKWTEAVIPNSRDGMTWCDIDGCDNDDPLDEF